MTDDIDDQMAVGAYKAASICSAWWTLDESTRRRYFTTNERKFMRRYGAKLDELSCQRTNPRNEDEHHFVLVCLGQAEPRSDRERLWLYARMVCPYERSLLRAARTDLVEYENAALRIENRSLRVDLQTMEREYMELLGEWRMATGEQQPRQPVCNVVWRTSAFNCEGSSGHRRFAPCSARGAGANVTARRVCGAPMSRPLAALVLLLVAYTTAAATLRIGQEIELDSEVGCSTLQVQQARLSILRDAMNASLLRQRGQETTESRRVGSAAVSQSTAMERSQCKRLAGAFVVQEVKKVDGGAIVRVGFGAGSLWVLRPLD